jgi:hypothetical protein
MALRSKSLLSFQDVLVKSENDRVEVMGLKSGGDLFVWMFNADKNPIEDLAVNIPEAGNLQYLLKTYDTWTGSFSGDTEKVAVDGRLVLNGIRLKSGRDAAAWLRPAEK